MGNLTNERYAEIFQILASSYLGVHVLLHKNNHRRNKQADSECHKEDIHLPGSCGEHAAPRGGNHTRIISGESLGKLVLLTFLKQVKIQFLLHLLLAFHGKQVFRLVRVGGQLAGGRGFLLAYAAYLGIERHDQVVHRLNDGALHALQRVGHVLCQGVLFAAVGDQAVAVEHHRVVFTDLALDIDIGYAGIGGQQLAEFLVVQLSADILRSG